MNKILKVITSKDFTMFIIIVIISIIFYKPIIIALNNLSVIVEPHSSFIIGFGLLTVFITFFFFYLIFHRYIPSNKITFLVCLVSVIYFIYRFIINEKLHYLSIKNSPFYFEDLIFVIFLLYISLLCFNFFKTKENIWNKYEKDNLDIEEENQDYIKIINQIEDDFKVYRGENSYSIGIIGEYGIGKTTLLTSLYKKFEKNNNIVTCWFEPWLYKDTDSLTKGFIEMIERKLSEYSGKVSCQLDSYLYDILKLSNQPIVNLILNIFYSKKESIELQNDIKKSIKEIDKTIIIIIDDLDRLNTEEIKQVLIILRSISHFPNFVFILGLHFEKVKVLIKEDDNYLDKFFNLKYSLPHRDFEDLSQIYINKLQLWKN